MRKILVVLTLAAALGLPVSAAMAEDGLHDFSPVEKAPAIDLTQGTNVELAGPSEKPAHIDFRGENMGQ